MQREKLTLSSCHIKLVEACRVIGFNLFVILEESALRTVCVTSM